MDIILKQDQCEKHGAGTSALSKVAPSSELPSTQHASPTCYAPATHSPLPPFGSISSSLFHSLGILIKTGTLGHPGEVLVFRALVSDWQSSAERKITGAASGAALAMWFSCLPTASSCFYYYYYIVWPWCVYSHDSSSFFSFLIIISINSMNTAKQTLVLGDLFCHMKITVCYRLDDHDFSSAGAQSQAVLLLLLLQNKVSQVQPQVSADLAGIPTGYDSLTLPKRQSKSMEVDCSKFFQLAQSVIINCICPLLLIYCYHLLGKILYFQGLEGFSKEGKILVEYRCCFG